MIIGIDATCWWNNRGFGRFTRELLTAIFELNTNHSFILISDTPLDPDLARFANVKVVLVHASKPTTEAAVADSSRSPVDMFRLYRAVAALELDIMFFPAVYSWYPVPRSLATMVTVHDAIAEHYPKLIFPHWRSRLFWTIKMKAAVWSSSRLLTVSNAALREIVQFIGVKPEKIDIASEAPGAIFRRLQDGQREVQARRRANLPETAPLITFVGGLAPHKNLHGLLDGFQQALKAGKLGDVHLGLVGDFQGGGFFSNYESLLARVAESPELRDRVHFSNHVSDEDLVALYNSSLAVAMPSYSEGFGLPAVEAMACGAPVLSSSRGSLPEVVGGAGVYFDPFDVDSIAKAIEWIVTDTVLREELSITAVERAKQFTWASAARLTVNHLETMGADR